MACRRWLTFAATTLVVTALAGCATPVSGTAARTPGEITSDGVDLELLDTGNYPTTPRQELGTAGTPEVGTRLEAGRLATYVVLPSTVDPSLVNGTTMGRSYAGADTLDDLLPAPSSTPTNPMVDAARAHGFVAGYSSSRYRAQDGPDRLALENSVLLFPDDAAATAAAADLAAAFASAWPDVPNSPLPIPGHPETIAFSDDFGSGPQVKSFTADGRYVLYIRAGAASTDAAAALIAATLDAQRVQLSGFAPTDSAALVDLPVDPSGLLARTLPTDDHHGYVRDAVAALHNEPDPIQYQKAFDDAGVVSVANGGLSTVYQTSEDGGGAVMRDALARLVADARDLQPAEGISGMPNVACFVQPTTATSDAVTWCFGSAGKYAFEISGLQETAVHQMAAAQYLMLTSP